MEPPLCRQPLGDFLPRIFAKDILFSMEITDDTVGFRVPLKLFENQSTMVSRGLRKTSEHYDIVGFKESHQLSSHYADSRWDFFSRIFAQDILFCKEIERDLMRI